MSSLSSRSATSRPPQSNTKVADNRLASFLLAGWAAAALLASGCSDAQIDATVKKLFQPKRTAQQYMLIAVSDTDPDVRRDAVVHVAESRKRDEEWALKGFVAIALLEEDPQARCVAIRALGHSGDRRAFETCLKILNHRRHPPNEVQPPDDLCRWDATEALAELSAGALPEDLRAEVRQTFMDRLKGDPDRYVRIAAAEGLRHFPEPEALRNLIDGLRDEDFAVVHQCENSLAWLTGVTHDCDPYRWEQWLERNRDDVFANAGSLPESRRPPYNGRWGKFTHDTTQFFRWIFPGSKEK